MSSRKLSLVCSRTTAVLPDNEAMSNKSTRGPFAPTEPTNVSEAHHPTRLGNHELGAAQRLFPRSGRSTSRPNGAHINSNATVSEQYADSIFEAMDHALLEQNHLNDPGFFRAIRHPAMTNTLSSQWMTNHNSRPSSLSCQELSRPTSVQRSLRTTSRVLEDIIADIETNQDSHQEMSSAQVTVPSHSFYQRVSTPNNEDSESKRQKLYEILQAALDIVNSE